MTLDELKQITEEYFNVNLLEKSRKSYLIKCRFLFYHTAYRMFPNETLSSLGRYLGQTHATVLHGIKELPYIVKYDKRFANSLEGYYKVVKITDELKIDIKTIDYDGICQYRANLIDQSARMKIDNLKKKVKNLQRVNKRLVSKINYYHDMCGV